MQGTVQIKRYHNNRKMYDYSIRDYVIMEDIQLYVDLQTPFQVTCGKTGQDITELCTLLAAVGKEKARLKEEECKFNA